MGFYNKYIFYSNSYFQNHIVRNTVRKYKNSDNLDSLIDKTLSESIAERSKYLVNRSINNKLVCLRKKIIKYRSKLNNNVPKDDNKKEKKLLSKFTNTEIKDFKEISINTSPKKYENVCTNTSPIMNSKISKSLKIIEKESNEKKQKNYYNNKANASINDRIHLNKN